MKILTQKITSGIIAIAFVSGMALPVFAKIIPATPTPAPKITPTAAPIRTYGTSENNSVNIKTADSACEATYNAAIKQANADYSAAVKSANDTYASAVKTAKDAYKAALSSAKTKEEKATALKTYKASLKDARKAKTTKIQSALAVKKTAKKTAKNQLLLCEKTK